jgi:wyosine [tRNA(Phe)-imidazoG37] synthetase (radical SAM superfamily)
MEQAQSLVFGPVPSRRLGRSLGINNLPCKTCSYACAYCQVGPTTALRSTRRAYYAPRLIERAVATRLAQAEAHAERVDYLTFVPDGEPTLDAHLGESIRRVKALGVRVAVVTNGSLLWHPQVRAELIAADWVSVKVDTVREATWRRLNRPYRRLRLARVLDGMWEFARWYTGTLTTETMLVAGVNDGDDEVAATAEYVRTLHPSSAYLLLPLRPPAEPWVQLPNQDTIARACTIMRETSVHVRCLTSDEEDTFSSVGDVADALLGIAAVHPMRAEAVQRLLERSGAEWAIVERLVQEGRLSRTTYRGRDFYRTAHA